MLASMSSCDRSQNMDNTGHFSTQEFGCTNSNTCADGRNVFMNICESPRRVYLGPDDEEKNDLYHAGDSLIAKQCCLSGNSLIATPSQAPSSKQEAKSYCDCQSEIGAKRRDGNPPRILNPGTQTAALSYCDASVQCSLIHDSKSVSFPTADQKTNVLTTGRQSFHLNQMLNPTTLSSPKDGHKRTGKRGASAKNQHAQRHPKSQTGSFRKLRCQKSTKRDLTSILKHKASEQKKEQMWEASVKIERCDSLCLESVTQNPVKDVRRAGESVKEMKKFTAEKGVNSKKLLTFC